MTTIVALDLETTGLDPERHHIWEIGAIVRGHRDPDLNGEWHIMLKPDLRTAEPKALQVSRYYERAWPLRMAAQAWIMTRPATVGEARSGGTSRPWVAQQVAELLDGAHIVGANPAFDAAHLARFLRTHGQAPTWDYHLVDVGALALGYLAALRRALDEPPPPVPWKSDELAAALGVHADPDARHTALGDARWALAMYDQVMGG